MSKAGIGTDDHWAKRSKYYTSDDISNKKDKTKVDFFDLATERAKFDKSQEKARKKARKALEERYDGHRNPYLAPVTPPESKVDPNDAFKREKFKLDHGIPNDIEEIEEGDWIDKLYDIDDEDWDKDETNQV